MPTCGTLEQRTPLNFVVLIVSALWALKSIGPASSEELLLACMLSLDFLWNIRRVRKSCSMGPSPLPGACTHYTRHMFLPLPS